MNYSWHYDKLIETRKNRILLTGAYYERHHIVMKSMGGTNDESNLIYLTAREHFIAHWLLWRIHRNRQSASAFFAMSNLLHRRTESFKITSRMYEELRIAAAKGNEFRRGVKHSSETIDKMKLARSKYVSNSLGKTWNGSNQSKALMHHECSIETRNKIGDKLRGRSSYAKSSMWINNGEINKRVHEFVIETPWKLGKLKSAKDGK